MPKERVDRYVSCVYSTDRTQAVVAKLRQADILALVLDGGLDGLEAFLNREGRRNRHYDGLYYELLQRLDHEPEIQLLLVLTLRELYAYPKSVSQIYHVAGVVEPQQIHPKIGERQLTRMHDNGRRLLWEHVPAITGHVSTK